MPKSCEFKSPISFHFLSNYNLTICIYRLRFETKFTRYIQFVHLVTVATQGDNVNPRNNIETIFSILVTIFGAAGMATIFGKIFD